MVFSRVVAAICTFLLIGSVALGAIALVAWLGPILAHGDQAEHVAGKLAPGKNSQEVVLITANEQTLRFRCQQRCLTQLDHIQRHIAEQAHTDVYYLRGPDNTLIAIDVD